MNRNRQKSSNSAQLTQHLGKSAKASLNGHGHQNKQSPGIDRWKFLKKAILNKDSAFSDSRHSIRRFNSFGFIKCVKEAYNSSRLKTDRYEQDEDLVVKNKKNYEWYSVAIPSIDPRISLNVRFYNSSVNLNDLTGFNNTGNICLWPSEEIMALFCAKNSTIFDNKSVCELGGGMTCLAGLMIGKYSQPKEVFLTDGNETSFENLEKICDRNEFECSVECCLLQWNKNLNYGDLEERFDYILCADW
ncbi:calmodulin-lysine N-methyltransferase [Brachionus plicatilis]|uniref:Calmodulin-lysine N-methyltransferase n=1 Tax=Brachionus plicatilis TaxID=10195 RepID=A0A3M7SFD0_BRAPC|nr:calmodulin-lysine N-methyltransferase [Brachionus plicatilis]